MHDGKDGVHLELRQVVLCFLYICNALKRGWKPRVSIHKCRLYPLSNLRRRGWTHGELKESLLGVLHVVHEGEDGGHLEEGAFAQGLPVGEAALNLWISFSPPASHSLLLLWVCPIV
jgi:hypothetical protein